jgi:hypothetical protein
MAESKKLPIPVIKKNTEPEHSRYSPSKSYLWLNCGECLNIIDTLPEPPETAASKRGTELHAKMEKFNIDYCGISYFHPYNLPRISRNKPSKKHKAKTYEDFLKAAELPPGKMSKNLYTSSKDFTIKVMNDVVPSLSKSSALGGKHLPIFSFYEEKVRMTSINKKCYGTADYLAISPRCLYVMDYKFGYMKVKADSSQLILYAIGAFETLMERNPRTGRKRDWKKVFPDVDSVCNVVIQPEHYTKPRYFEYSIEDLLKYRKRYHSMAKKPGARIGEWCEYFAQCRPHCKKYQKKRIAETRAFFDA